MREKAGSAGRRPAAREKTGGARDPVVNMADLVLR
jgi:hypothetical protein